MKRVKIVKDGVVTHRTEIDDALVDTWVREFTASMGDPSTYQVIEEDMTAEIAARDAAKTVRNQLRADLRAIRDGSGNMTAAQLAQAFRAFLKLQNLEAE